jgi:small subunit ribosomal protein S8e
MGIGRDSRHKRRATGGRMPVHQKKRKFEMARTPANTKLGPKQVRSVRGRGANYKYRALKIDNGNFTWGSEQITKKTRILDVVYNATNNELVRTKTIVKNAIVHIDGNPFKQYYSQNYDVELGKKKEVKEPVAGAEGAAAATTEVKKKSRHVLAVAKKRQAGRVIDNHVAEQFKAGRILACVTSRPGQSGRADGYILEGKELEFYVKKMEKRKK